MFASLFFMNIIRKIADKGRRKVVQVVPYERSLCKKQREWETWHIIDRVHDLLLQDTHIYTHMRVKIFRHGIGGSAAILRVSVGVASHSVEGFYYGEGDRGRSSKVIHHFLPCRSFVDSFHSLIISIVFSNNRQTWRWSRQPDSLVLRDSRDFRRLKEIVFRGCIDSWCLWFRDPVKLDDLGMDYLLT